MEKIKNVIANIKAKAREKKEMATTVLDNRGLSETAQQALWMLVGVLVVALIFVGVKKFFPQLFTDIFAKFTEMLDTWTITTA